MKLNWKFNWNIKTFVDSLSIETKIGISIALFAALMAINDLFGGAYGEDEIKFTNEKAAAYAWYQSKGLKETFAEGQKDLLNSFIKAGVIQNKAIESVHEFIKELDLKARKYSKEKKEILLGSAKLAEKDWAQDVDGKMGQIIGAKDYEEQLIVLGKAGDRFDLASLFFQISLVIGAISLIVKSEKSQKLFFHFMAGLGFCACTFSILAFLTIHFPQFF